MNILAIDSALGILSVAVANGDTIYYTEADEGMKHSELVMGSIDSLMKKANLEPKDLNGVLCMGGPGSFTGLRIGYSIAKGLALSLSIPFAPVPTLDCIALQETEGIILGVIESKKNAWFYAFFKNGQRLTNDNDGDSAQIAKEINSFQEKITLTGPAAPLLYDSLPQEQQKRLSLNFEKKGYAKEIILIAQIRKILDNNNVEYLCSGPEYIRMADVHQSYGGS